MNTERYQYLIYSWNYGIELSDLYGQPIPYVYAEIQRRITEALLSDDRISNVTNFNFSNPQGGDVFTTFDVVTDYGIITNVSERRWENLYENMTYERIQKRILNRVKAQYDKREGSIIFDATAPIFFWIGEAYIMAEVILKETFASTASRWGLN